MYGGYHLYLGSCLEDPWWFKRFRSCGEMTGYHVLGVCRGTGTFFSSPLRCSCAPISRWLIWESLPKTWWQWLLHRTHRQVLYELRGLPGHILESTRRCWRVTRVRFPLWTCTLICIFLWTSQGSPWRTLERTDKPSQPWLCPLVI